MKKNAGNGVQDDKSTFVRGAFILGVAGIVTRIIGAFFRIPLGNILSLEAMGYYSAAYPVYAFFVVLSTSGLPTAVARMVAERKVIGDYNGIKRTFRAGAILMMAIGAIGFVFLTFGGGLIASIIKSPGAAFSIRILGPAVFLVTLIALYRGYFQGFQEMEPFAWSLVIEQIGRVIVGYTLAVMLIGMGPVYAAGGATFGAVAGGVAGLAVMLFSYKKNDPSERLRRTKLPNNMNDSAWSIDSAGRKEESRKITLKTKKGVHDTVTIAFTKFKDKDNIVQKMLKISIPITIGASVLPIINLVDVGLVINRLVSIGYNPDRANELFSMLTGYAATMVNLPQAITSAIQIAIVPAIASYFSMKHFKDVKNVLNSGIKLTAIVALPSAAGLSILSSEILSLLYPAQSESIAIMGSILTILGFSVIFLGLFQVTTGIMQGVGKQNIPAINLVIAVIVKFLLNYILVGIPELNIYGAAISTVISYAVALTLNFVFLSKALGYKIPIVPILSKPVMATLLMSAAVIVTTWIWPVLFLSRLRTLIAIMIGVAVYTYAILAFGVFTPSDYELMPGGNKIRSLENRLFRRNHE